MCDFANGKWFSLTALIRVRLQEKLSTIEAINWIEINITIEKNMMIVMQKPQTKTWQNWMRVSWRSQLSQLSWRWWRRTRILLIEKQMFQPLIVWYTYSAKYIGHHTCIIHWAVWLSPLSFPYSGISSQWLIDGKGFNSDQLFQCNHAVTIKSKHDNIT